MNDQPQVGDAHIKLSSPLTNDQLVQEALQIDDWIEQQNKAFAEHLKPYKDRRDEIGKIFMVRLIEGGMQSVKTDHGTAYKSTIITPKIVDKAAYLNEVFANWQTWGQGMLQVGAPQKDAVTEYQQANEGKLPAGVDQNTFTRINIRRS